MHFAVYLLAITALINIGLGSFVYFRNPKLLTSRSFLLITFSVALWCAGLIGFYSFEDSDQVTLSVQVFYIAALLMNASLLVFTGAFFKTKQKILYYYVPALSWLLMSMAIIIAPDSLFEVMQTGDSFDVELQGVTYGVYTFFVIGYYVLTLWTFFKHHRDGSAKNQQQIKYILAGLVFAGIFASYFNVLLPGLGQYDYVWSGPLFTLGFVGAISYAIIKHGLFDIRNTVARTLAYVLSISFVALVYLSIVVFIGSTDVVSGELTAEQSVVFLVVAVLSGLLFGPSKRYFDKLTGKIFFRDAYDPQAFIDKLNNNLINKVDLEELLTKSALIIQENLKASFCTFYIRETSYFPDRIIGAHRKDPEVDDLDDLQNWAPKLHTKIHSVELHNATVAEKEVTKILRKNDVEVMARLVNTLDFEVKGIGYILIGPKKSGSQFSKQDLKIMEIVTNELVIATENVLRFEEIEQFNVTLQKKIDDATKELKTSNAKLRALDEAKDEFVSMASHQLRTPLTSIKGYISMVLEGDAGKVNETQSKMLGQALFSSQRMVYLISDLLNVSRLKTGKFTIEQKPVYLPDIVQSEVEQLYEGAGAKNITLSFKKPKDFPKLNLDEMKIRQVVMNFTDNAIYYTPDKGKIDVELKETGKSIEFTVKDSGIGVPKAQQPKLFTKFYRADNARKARPDGTGLGLFMAKKVIIAQGGSMIFKSAENKGSTFGFSFPKDKLEVKKDTE